GAALQIACVTELAVQRRLELAVRSAGFTAAHQAVVVRGVQTAAFLLPVILPIALDLIELVEAPDARARRTNLAAACASGNIDARHQRSHRGHDAAGDPTPGWQRRVGR